MLILFGGGFITACFGLAGVWFEERDPELSRWMGFPFGVGVLTLMGYMLYRAEFAKPSCPSCGRPMTFERVLMLPRNSKWRVFACASCRCACRVPGMSLG